MRQLAKSAMSLGWALSLLGAKQAYGTVTAGRNTQGDLFGPVTQAAVDQLDESMKRIHRSADNLESRMVDMACSFLDPARWMKSENWRFWATADANSTETSRSGFDQPDGSASSHACNSDSSAWGAGPDDDSSGNYNTAS